MKLLIISGGSKGLGLALCQAFQEKGFSIIEFSRTAPHPYSVPLDLSQYGQALEIIEHSLSALAGESWEEIVVINNAGTLSPIGLCGQNDTADVLTNININFTSGLLLISEVMRQFQLHKNKKTLVNISSGAALKGYAGWSLYCAAKAGLENFIRSVALEQLRQEYPFDAININPGVMDTDMQALIRQSTEKDFPSIQRFIDFKENGLLPSPEEVASEVIKLIEQCSDMSGECLKVGEAPR